MPVKFEKRYKIAKPVHTAVAKFFKQRTTMDLEYILYDLGWFMVGSGAFSSVYENDKKPYIIKVNNRVDMSFAIFAQWVKQHSNKHFPKIGEMKKYVVGGKKYYIYLIEKLYNVPISRDYAIYIENLTASFVLNFKTKNRLTDHEVIKNFVEDDCGGDMPSIFKSQPTLISACKSLALCYYKNKMALDIHDGNIMQRKNRTVVIIDPFA